MLLESFAFELREERTPGAAQPQPKFGRHFVGAAAQRDFVFKLFQGSHREVEDLDHRFLEQRLPSRHDRAVITLRNDDLRVPPMADLSRQWLAQVVRGDGVSVHHPVEKRARGVGERPEIVPRDGDAAESIRNSCER